MLTCNYRDGRQGVGNLVNQEYVMLQNPGTEIGKANEVPREQILQGTHLQVPS